MWVFRHEHGCAMIPPITAKNGGKCVAKHTDAYAGEGVRIPHSPPIFRPFLAQLRPFGTFSPARAGENVSSRWSSASCTYRLARKSGRLGLSMVLEIGVSDSLVNVEASLCLPVCQVNFRRASGERGQRVDSFKRQVID